MQATLDTLVSLLPSDVFFGKIHYVSSNESTVSDEVEKMTDRVLRKLDHYAYEKEVRAIVLDNSELDKETDKGKVVEINVQKLANSIIVPPNTEEKWIRDVIEQVLNQYDLSSKVRKSNFDIPGTVKVN